MVLLHPTYFSPIIQYVAIVKSKQILFEVEDNFQKQTYRNRCYIYTANGKHLLNIPIQHTKGSKQKTKDVKIDYKYNWNKLHLKTLETAYNSSPFFEFYIDDLKPIFEKQFTFLTDLNLKCHEITMNALQLDIPFAKTSEFVKEVSCFNGRNFANAKSKEKINLKRYIQVFDQNKGFIPNLSILDLLFMEGPNALNYLENQTINF
ncbi:WbqC family protein [Lutibacter sp.]